MHLVGFGFQPAKIALNTVPGLGPSVRRVRAIARFALDNKVLPLLGHLVEGDVGWDPVPPAHPQEVVLALGALSGLPWLHQTFGQGLGAIGDGQAKIDADGTAKATAGRARPDRMIETK